MNLLETTDFTISVTGDKSGETYHGTFSCLRRLSHRQELLKDRLYREFLGSSPESASERAKSQAELLAECRACLVKVPPWWKESNERTRSY